MEGQLVIVLGRHNFAQLKKNAALHFSYQLLRHPLLVLTRWDCEIAPHLLRISLSIPP